RRPRPPPHPHPPRPPRAGRGAGAEARPPAPGLRREGATKERTSDEGGGRGPERAEASAGNTAASVRYQLHSSGGRPSLGPPAATYPCKGLSLNDNPLQELAQIVKSLDLFL